MKTKSALLPMILIIMTFSCEQQDTVLPDTGLPVLHTEKYFNGETGELFATKMYQYDSVGRVVEAHYEDEVSPGANKLITWLYEEGGTKVIRTTNYYNRDQTELHISIYESGNLISESMMNNLNQVLSEKKYYYSEGILDSVQFYLDIFGDLRFNHSEIYEYQHGRLAQVLQRQGESTNVKTHYVYNGDQLQSRCEGTFKCDYYFYIGNELKKIESRYEFDDPVIIEEQFYENGLIQERKLYGTVSYDLSDVRNLTNIEFSYSHGIQ